MQSPEDNRRCRPHSKTELDGGDHQAPFSNGPKKSTQFNLPKDNTTATTADDQMETTVDVREDSVAVHCVKAAGDGAVDNPEKKLSFGSSIGRNASSRIKQVSEDIKQLASRTRRPRPVARLHRTNSTAAQALKELKFISKADGGATWALVEERFNRLTSTTHGMLPRSLFGECIGMKDDSDKEFAGKLFDALARGSNISGDSITKAELAEFWVQIADQSFNCRLRTFFDMVDQNGDGRITEDEIAEIIRMSASANKLPNIRKEADVFARIIMEMLDPQHLGYIMIEKLQTLLLLGPKESIRDAGGHNLSKIMRSNQLKPAVGHPLKRWCRASQLFLLDNWQRVWVVALWVAAMAALFAYKYVQYRNKAAFGVMGHCVCMAKGAAETLKLNMALILFPMCRNTITWLRNNTRLGAAVPFDDNISFHKTIATAVATGVGIHGLSHLACDFPRLLNASPEKYRAMQPFVGDQPTSYWFFVKGCEGVTGIAMVVLMAIAFTLAFPWFRKNSKILPEPLRKLTGFNAFWYSHHLFIIVYALLIIHGVKLYFIHEWYQKTTWMYLAIPMILYGGERLTRTLRSRMEAVTILKAAVHPAQVIVLHMSKPHGFKYRSGQYIFVKCRDVSPFEWHPFSITTSPMDDYLSVHIRMVGDWTRHLGDVILRVCEPPPKGRSGHLGVDFLELRENSEFPNVLIDGPYGAPTQDYKDYEVVLLIGLGIGATPMVSVVKDILSNIKAEEEKEERALEEGKIGGSRPWREPEFKTRRTYFYWSTREQGSFDWFRGVMNEVSEMDHNGVIEMHTYCTSVHEEGDARSALITVLQAIYYASKGEDIVSRTKIKSHFARPNWSAVYNRIARDHPNSTVGVFYCGDPKPAKKLRHLASEFSHDTSTKFVFHKENF